MQIDVRDNIEQAMAGMKSYSRNVLDKATMRALNRTATMARTATSRVLRDDGYNFTSTEIKNAIRISSASSARLIATMKIRRRTKSLMAFSPRQSKAGVTVKVHGNAKLIAGAFIAQMRNGASGVFVEDKAAGKTTLRMAKQYKRGSRGGWHDYPARKLYGPSVGGTYGTGRIQDLMRSFINKTFAANLRSQLAFLGR